ncbi:hypothetical protein NL108_016715 [Boleophthalmus pectinirostris]|nr:hypothetical protein NL108_016715 [Boleophthalmus pectinirostris]
MSSTNISPCPPQTSHHVLHKHLTMSSTNISPPPPQTSHHVLLKHLTTSSSNMVRSFLVETLRCFLVTFSSFVEPLTSAACCSRSTCCSRLRCPLASGGGRSFRLF